MKPTISLVTTGRNDDYKGNFLWRLETTLNYIGKKAAKVGRSGDVELVVVDWGSRLPLHSALNLSEDALKIARFILVPPDIAERYNTDGIFAGSIAINAGVRRSRGMFIAQTGGDILYNEDLLDRLLRLPRTERYEKFLVNRTLFHILLKKIPEDFVRRDPDVESIERYIDENNEDLEATPVGPFLGGRAAALLMHRDLWFECQGLDESWFGYGWTDCDLNLRIGLKYASTVFGSDEGLYAYHLEHPRDGLPITGRYNPFVVNGRSWGVAEHRFEEFPANNPVDIPVMPDGAETGRGQSYRWKYFSNLLRFLATNRDVESLREGYYAFNLLILDLPDRNPIRKAYVLLKKLKDSLTGV